MVRMDPQAVRSDEEAAILDAETDAVNIAIGNEIRGLRGRRRWNQEQLAQAIGVDKKTVGRLERGERSLTVTLLYKLCKVFGVMPSDLIKGTVDFEIGIK